MPSVHPQERLTKIFAEAKTAELTATITKKDGVTPVPLASLVEVTLTLFVEKDGAIINSRDSDDIKNANGGTVHATSGLLTLLLSPLDMAVLLTGQRFETHVALIEWKYDTVEEGGQEIAFTVQNFAKVS